MEPGDLYSNKSGGRRHLIVEVVVSPGGWTHTGTTACRRQITDTDNRAEPGGHVGLDYSGEWLTCLECRAQHPGTPATDTVTTDVQTLQVIVSGPELSASDAGSGSCARPETSGEASARGTVPERECP